MQLTYLGLQAVESGKVGCSMVTHEDCEAESRSGRDTSKDTSSTKMLSSQGRLTIKKLSPFFGAG